MRYDKNILILDCDGVLLEWMCNIPFFAAEHGISLKNVLRYYNFHGHASCEEIFQLPLEHSLKLVKEYNEGKYGRYLKPFNDAVTVVPTLAEELDIVVVTNFGSTLECVVNRKFNLECFYPNCIKNMISLNIHESKENALRGIIDDANQSGVDIIGFVDDQINNLETANKLGIPAMMLNHFSTEGACNVPDMPRFANFFELDKHLYDTAINRDICY